MKVYKVRDPNTGLFKKSSASRNYSSSAYWSTVGIIYSTKGHAVSGLRKAKERVPEAELVTFELVEIKDN